MSLTTYAGLQDEVEKWINDPSLTLRIPIFIQLAEAVISRRIKHREMMGVYNFTTSNEFISVPENFAGVRSIKVSAGGYSYKLEYLSPDAWADLPVQSGTPNAYTITAGRIYLHPSPPDPATPDTDLSGRLVYSMKIDSLVYSGMNWLLSNFPDVYLWGTLSQAAKYIGNDERQVDWDGLFERAIQTVNLDGQIQSQGGTMQQQPGVYLP